MPRRNRSGDLPAVRMTLVLPFAVLLGASAAAAQTAVAPASARSALGLTVYEGFAVVRETRAVPGGAREVVWPDVPPSLDPGSVVV